MDLVKARKRAEALKAKEKGQEEIQSPAEIPPKAKKKADGAKVKAAQPDSIDSKEKKKKAPPAKKTAPSKAVEKKPARKKKSKPAKAKALQPEPKANGGEWSDETSNERSEVSKRAAPPFPDLEGPVRHHKAPEPNQDSAEESQSELKPVVEESVTEEPEDVVANFDPEIHFVDFQAEREAQRMVEEEASKPWSEPPPPSAPSPSSDVPTIVRRDAREDPSFEEILKPQPADREVLGLMDRADSNPEYPYIDAPDAPKRRMEPLATMVEETIVQMDDPQTVEEVGAFDEIWEDEEARLLGLVAEELFRRAYGEEHVREETGEKYIGFQLAGEYYAINILEVGEVIKMKERTPVPHAPDHVAGIVSLRGAIIPVVDLRRWLGLPEKDLLRSARILILKKGNRRSGFIVDHVLGVVKIPPDSVEPAPASINKIDAEFISGVGRLEGRFYVLLNTNRMIEIVDKLDTQTKASA